LDRTFSHSGKLFLSRQLTRHLTVSISGGRLWSFSEGGAVIPLSPLLTEIFGTPALSRDDSRFVAFWTGAANLLSHWQWQKVNISFGYNRSISANNLLGRPAQTHALELDLGRLLGRSTFVSGYISYARSDFYTLKDSRELDQGTARVSLSRPLVGGLDFSIFVNYSRLFRGVENTSLFNHLQGGVSFVYQLPRVRQE
jgi:hypothetical protein